MLWVATHKHDIHTCINTLIHLAQWNETDNSIQHSVCSFFSWMTKAVCVKRQTGRLASTQAKVLWPWQISSHVLWALGHVWRGGIGLGIGDDVLACLEASYDTRGVFWRHGSEVFQSDPNEGRVGSLAGLLFFRKVFTEQPQVGPFLISRIKLKHLLFFFLLFYFWLVSVKYSLNPLQWEHCLTFLKSYSNPYKALDDSLNWLYQDTYTSLIPCSATLCDSAPLCNDAIHFQFNM